MRKVQVFSRLGLYKNDGDKVIAPSGFHGHSHVSVTVPSYIGHFHEFIILLCEDGYSTSYAIVESNKGVIVEEPINDIQFIRAIGAGEDTAHIGVTHKDKEGGCYRYGKDGSADKWVVQAWIKPIKAVTNFDLYLDKNKYIPI